MAGKQKEDLIMPAEEVLESLKKFVSVNRSVGQCLPQAKHRTAFRSVAAIINGSRPQDELDFDMLYLHLRILGALRGPASFGPKALGKDAAKLHHIIKASGFTRQFA